MVMELNARRRFLSILLGARGCFSNLSHRFYSTFLAIPIAISLTSCGTPKPEVVKPPASRLVCSDEPLAPDAATPAATAAYMIGLRAAWQDCHSNLQWVKDFFAGQK